MKSPKSKALNVRGRAILIGYDPEGKCVYSDNLDLSDYYDGQHPWDDGENVKKMRLHKLKGYLFDSEGALDQEFESLFDLESGTYKTGNARFADGTIKNG
jgi:hypothetical protein